MKIIITKRTDHYHAHIEGEPGKWGCGKSIHEAIGDLVTAWSAEFNIELFTT